jgi:hypothetical protein
MALLEEGNDLLSWHHLGTGYADELRACLMRMAAALEASSHHDPACQGQ